MGLGINYVILANHLVSLITSSTTDPRLLNLIVMKARLNNNTLFQKHYTQYIII